MRGGSASVVLTALLATALGWAAVPTRDLVVVRGGSTLSVPVEGQRGYPAARALALAQALGYTWTGEVLNVDGEQVRFVSGSPFFTVGADVFQLPNPAYRSGSHLMVPVSWALEWLPQRRPRRWRYLDGRLVERPRTTPRPPERDSWLVVIDPGHGGRDPGAIGVRGTKEKDITLAVARRLAEQLRREPGYQVVLTRDRDTLITLADRPRAPQLKGVENPPDLFLSIHCNSMPRKPNNTRGFETYFLAVAKTEEARRVALRENASLRFESDTPISDVDPLQFILSDLQSTANLRESNLFAGFIDRSVQATLRSPSLGVRQAGFVVLVGAAMPAALVEVGYLSNKDEERLLRSPSHQAKIADALADAVVNYLLDYGRRVWSSYSTGG